MSFDYHKGRGSHSQDSFWTSYSDLFLGLSTIFLLLYVTASLRTGTDAIRAQVDSQKLTMENEELKSQLRMYESVKEKYLKNSASQDELKDYRELMDKLTLLKEDAKSDRERLARESLENDRKAAALNKYQQMVRNIINANKVAKTKLQTRNDLIDEQDSELTQKKQLIEEGRRQIASTSSALKKSQDKLLKAYRAHQISRKVFEARNRKLAAQAEERIKALETKNEAHIQDLRAAFATEKAREKAAFDSELQKSQADAAEKDRRAAEFRASAEAKERDMNGRIAGLQGQLAKAKEELEARREIAKEIRKGFAGAGIKADVDMQTGEVILDFGNNYFESDSANLKMEMKDIIERAMPVYSRSLFGNQKIAAKISAVEIIGFASPTYRGRFVDPQSRKPEDRAALKYNMDLSYRRANSIFNYLIDEKGPEFEHKQGLMALMKVSGRSFLEVMNVKNRGSASAQDFCRMNDCRKAQRVIVRFSMDRNK